MSLVNVSQSNFISEPACCALDPARLSLAKGQDWLF